MVFELFFNCVTVQPKNSEFCLQVGAQRTVGHFPAVEVSVVGVSVSIEAKRRYIVS